MYISIPDGRSLVGARPETSFFVFLFDLVKKSKKPLFSFELQIANDYANIFEDVKKNKINKLENYVQNKVLKFKLNTERTTITIKFPQLCLNACVPISL